MDVKHLERVNDDGLEQWRPVLKAAFPLSSEQAGSVLATLNAADAPLGRTAYTLDELLDEVVGPIPDLEAVHVHKTRRHVTVGGCMAELTSVSAEGRSVQTIAVESEDPSGVTAAVRELGLDLRPNVSFPRGLKALLGLGAQRYAVVDVGTNSVKFHIGERGAGANGEWRTVVDRAEVTRLGEGLGETGRIGPEAMDRTVSAIAGMADEAGRAGVVGIAAVGTAGLRAASNGAELVGAVRERCGITIEVIPGEEEGRLAYLAATSGLGLVQGSLVVFDTGGGSTEFTFGHDQRVDERFSVEVGAVRLTERFGLDGAVSETELAAALDATAADLARLDGRPPPDALVGMGGSVTNLAAVKHELATYDPEVVQGTVLDLTEVDRQIELYRTRAAEERREIAGLQPKRADIILAGACIVRTAIVKLGRESLTVSDRGLRHGLLAERFGR
jgi:exopolyphosphatase / guanosine-5'-triphosphate,3'-diphosphate pyrophosphatase